MMSCASLESAWLVTPRPRLLLLLLTVHPSCVQVLGGYGYTGEYRVEQLWRDVKLLEIGAGTVEAHHKNLTKDLATVVKLP